MWNPSKLPAYRAVGRQRRLWHPLLPNTAHHGKLWVSLPRHCQSIHQSLPEATQGVLCVNNLIAWCARDHDLSHVFNPICVFLYIHEHLCFYDSVENRFLISTRFRESKQIPGPTTPLPRHQDPWLLIGETIDGSRMNRVAMWGHAGAITSESPESSDNCWPWTIPHPNE